MGKRRRYEEEKDNIKYAIEYKKKKHKDYVEYLALEKKEYEPDGSVCGLIWKIRYSPKKIRVRIVSYDVAIMGEDRVPVPASELLTEFILFNPSDTISLDFDYLDLRQKIRQYGVENTIKYIMFHFYLELDRLKRYTDMLSC